MNYSFKIRFAQETSGQICAMAEMPPHERTLFAVSNGAVKPYRVALPWTVFVVPISDNSRWFVPGGIWAYFRDKPLESPASKLRVLPFANTGSHGYVCLGGICSFHESVEEVVASQIEAYFSTSFSSRAWMLDIPYFWTLERPFSRHSPRSPRLEWKEWSQP
jgi:hypothetical protein